MTIINKSRLILGDLRADGLSLREEEAARGKQHQFCLLRKKVTQAYSVVYEIPATNVGILRQSCQREERGSQ
jgi:hypothetical protein